MDAPLDPSSTSPRAWAEAIVEALLPDLLAHGRQMEADDVIAPTAQEMVKRLSVAFPTAPSRPRPWSEMTDC